MYFKVYLCNILPCYDEYNENPKPLYRLVDMGVTAAQTGLMMTTPGYAGLHWGYKAAQYASIVFYGVSAGMDAVAMQKCHETLVRLQQNLERGQRVNDK